ncbi:MAG: ATP-binding protein [Candidatus Falkowbacteria bacterium]
MLRYNFKKIVRLWVIPSLIIMLGAAAVFYAYYSITDTIYTEAQIIFEDKGTVAIYLLKHQLMMNAEMVKGLSGFFRTGGAFSAKRFSVYSQPLGLKDNYKAVVKLAFWTKKQQSDLAKATASSSASQLINKAYTADFVYYPQADSSSPGPAAVLGEIEAEAASRALDSGKPALSRKIILPQGLSGFIIVGPVFKDGVALSTPEARQRNVIGFVAAYVQADLFFVNNLLPTKSIGWAYYDLHVYDGVISEMGDKTLYYDFNKKHNDRADNLNGFNRRESFMALDRMWTVYGSGSVGNQVSGMRLATPGMILVGGLLFCLIITLLIRRSSGTTERAESLALKMTEGLRQSRSKLARQAKDLQQFKLAVDNANDHIVITDKDGLIIYANKGVENVTGFKREEVLGKKAGSKQLWGGQMSKDFYAKMWQSIKNDKQHFIGEINNLRKNGEPYIALSSVSPILGKDGEAEYFVAIEHDITREKEIDKEKTEFVSLASHQLRTPLTAIKWCTEILLAPDADKLTAKQSLYMKRIFQSNERMIDLVASLLNVARMDMGTMAVNLKQVDLRQAVEMELQELQSQIKLKDISVQTRYGDNLLPLETDINMLHIVLQNLLSNAVKYTPPQGQISLVAEQSKNLVVIKVIDTGYGIPLTAYSKIFNKLFRADNILDKETDGNGLGLYLVKAVVEKLGGNIRFESKINKGTTFYVELPLVLKKPKKSHK